MKQLCGLLLLLFSFVTSNAQVTLGFVKDGGFSSSTACGLTSVNVEVWSNTRALGQVALGDVIYSDAGGSTPFDGGFKWWAFTKTSGGAVHRVLQIDGSGVVQGIQTCTALTISNYLSTTFTANCSNNNFTTPMYAAQDDNTMYDGKPIRLSELGQTVAAGSYTASNVSGGTAVWTFSVVGITSVISSLACCSVNPIASAGGDASYTLPSPTINLSGSGFDCDGTIAGYNWTQVSGPNTATINNPTTQTPSITGVVSGTYVFRLTVTDNASNTGTDDVSILVYPVPTCPDPVKINILDSADWINQSGYIKPIAELFDGAADPLNGVPGTSTTLGNNTYPVPPTGEKFADYYDRIIGWLYEVDFRQTVDITQIWVYFRADGADTVDIYLGDSLYNFTKLANPTQQVPSATLYNTPGVYEWKSVILNSQTRYMRIRIRNAWFAGNPFSDGGITNFIVYGCRGTYIPIFTGRKKSRTLRQKNGTNIATQVSPINSNFQQQSWVRSYSRKNWIDDEVVAYPNNKYNPDFFTAFNNYNDSMKNVMNTLFWPTLLGTSQWLATTYSVDAGYAAYDSLNINTRLPEAYERLADMAWNYAAMMGTGINPAIDTPFMRQHNYGHINGGRKVYNLNQISALEDDNERDGWFQTKKLTPVEATAQASAFVDGDEGRLKDQWGNNRMGFKNADPNLLFIMSGTVGINHEEIKARIYNSIMLRGNVMWDVIQGHQYWSRFDDPVLTATTAGQINNWGTYPEDDSARYQYDYMVYWGNRLANDTLAYMTGEHGNDGVHYYPHDADEVSATRTQYGSPQLVELGSVALDSLQAQAVSIEQGQLSIGASNMVAGVQYLFHDLTPPTDLPGYLNAYISSGYIFHSGAKKPSWYRMQSQLNIIGDYYLDTIVSEVNGGLVHYKGRHIAGDSVVDVFYKAALTTGTGIAVSIPVYNATYAVRRIASYTSVQPSQFSVTISGGNVTEVATVTPKYIISYQPVGAGNLSPNSNAGADVNITAPTSVANINGSASSDPDGTITGYQWTQISGPNSATIVSATSAATNVSGLIVGVYVFNLEVTDNNGATDNDTVTVTVAAAPVVPSGHRYYFKVPKQKGT
jgi:hypothetical protein